MGSPAALAAALVAVLAVILVAIAWPRRGGPAQTREPFQGDLTTRLAARGWTVYLLDGCRFCHNQMRLVPGFGRTVTYDGNCALRSAYTQAPPIPCKSINAYPFWHNVQTGETRVGLQGRPDLEQMAFLINPI